MRASWDPVKKASPWIVFEQIGGFAGFHNALVLEKDGNWRAQDRVRHQERSGRFSPAVVDSIRALLEALPRGAWGSFSSKITDDFNYTLSMHGAGGGGELTRLMDGGGSALPRSWQPVIEILERPFAELRMRGPD